MGELVTFLWRVWFVSFFTVGVLMLIDLSICTLYKRVTSQDFIGAVVGIIFGLIPGIQWYMIWWLLKDIHTEIKKNEEI